MRLIRSALQENVVCKSLTEKELDELGATMESFVFKEGEYVCRQGDMGTHFFIILDGTFDVLVNNTVVNKMTRGKAFGELALIHNCPRSASVLATSTAALFGVHRKTFRRILKQLSQRSYEENRKFLDSISLFDLLTDAQKKVIVEAMHAHMYQKDAVVVREGEAGDMLFILKSGVLAVSINKKEVRQLKKGDYFGERSLLYEEPRSATVSCVEACVCVSIGKSQLQDVFKVGNLEHLLFQNVIRNSLKDSSVFKDFSAQQIDSLVDATVYSDFEAGAEVHSATKTGMEGVRFFIVLSGEILLSGDGVSGTKKTWTGWRLR
jgi:cGMP-dependent protein kinase